MLEIYLVVVFGAATLQGLVGFGFGLVCMSVLPFFVPVRMAVVLISILRAVPALTLFVQLRKHIGWREVAPLLAGAAVGVPVGVWFLSTASPVAVRLTLGCILVGYALWALVRKPPAEHSQVSRKWGLLAGTVGGVLGGGFNSGGPPVVLYAAVARWPRDMLRASLGSYFCTVIVIQLSLFAGSGVLTRDLLLVQVLALPAVALGTLLGSKLASRVPQERFQKGLLIMILTLGVAFLGRSVSQLL